MTSTNPKVSIIILSFNQSEYIDEAIKSVLSQTYQNLEIIISDNGSTDSTKDIILSYMDDQRIIFLDYEENLSISLRQNQAVSIATGEFISLLYADDYYLPSKIATQVQEFMPLSREWGVVHGPGFELDEMQNMQQLIKSTQAHGECLESLFEDYSDGFINPISPLIRREACIEFPLYEDIFSEGESVFFRIAMKYKFFYSSIPLVVMRYHEKNMGKAIKKNIEMHLICLDRLEQNIDFPKNCQKHLNIYRSHIIFSNAWHCIRTNFEISWAKKIILKAIRFYPQSILSRKFIIGIIFILMPRPVIAAANKMINLLLRKKYVAPLKDYYN
jgi:glycosyltransferase involved in cell wall biosynthesis